MAAEPRDKEAARQPAGNRGEHKRWSDLFWSSSKPSKVFQLRKWNDGDRDIAKDELRNLGYCLVAYILGRFPGRMAVENVQKSWNVASTCSRHESGWLIFRFNSEEDRDLVLMKGPFETMGAPWLMKKLPPFFKFDEASFSTVPTWIRLKGLPLECWTVNALGKLASFVGEPLAADECTASMSKTSFARILVEVDVTQALVREISTRLPDGTLLVQEVVYEREPQLCSKCKRIGHNVEHCRMHSSIIYTRSAKQQQAEHSQRNLQATTEQAGDNPQPPTAAVVDVASITRQTLNGKKAHKQSHVAADHTFIHTPAANPPQIMQPSANSDVLLLGHNSAACQQEPTADKESEILTDVVHDISMGAGRSTGNQEAETGQKQPTTASAAMEQHQVSCQPNLLQGKADVQTGFLHGDQMSTADPPIEAARQAMLEDEFPPLAVGEAGRTMMKTRKATAVKLVAANDKNIQQQQALRSEITLPYADHGNQQYKAHLGLQQDNVAASPSKTLQVQDHQPMAATTAYQITCNADDPMLQDTRLDTRETAPVAAAVQVPKQPAGPKWKNNRKTRSAAKKGGSPT